MTRPLRAVIQGWEFDSEGNKTEQSVPRVINENGSITLNNYSITFNNSALLEGKVIRRHNSPAFPTIPPPPPPDSNGSISLDSAAFRSDQRIDPFLPSPSTPAASVMYA